MNRDNQFESKYILIGIVIDRLKIEQFQLTNQKKIFKQKWPNNIKVDGLKLIINQKYSKLWLKIGYN